MKIRVLIVDDEPLVRSGLHELLAVEPDVTIVGECEGGEAAVATIIAERPELVFLDVRMPGLDGFQVLEALTDIPLPEVIFVTAHDEFALRAFDVHAVDYLLKPFTSARFRAALKRARQRLGQARGVRDGLSAERRLDALLDETRPADAPRKRFLVRTAGRVLFVELNEVTWFEAADNYVRLHVGDSYHLIRRTMHSLERDLDPERFLRIHRSAIVPVDQIGSVDTLPNGDHVVRLTGGDELSVGRSYRARLRERMDLGREGRGEMS